MAGNLGLVHSADDLEPELPGLIPLARTCALGFPRIAVSWAFMGLVSHPLAGGEPCFQCVRACGRRAAAVRPAISEFKRSRGRAGCIHVTVGMWGLMGWMDVEFSGEKHPMKLMYCSISAGEGLCVAAKLP